MGVISKQWEHVNVTKMQLSIHIALLNHLWLMQLVQFYRVFAAGISQRDVITRNRCEIDNQILQINLQKSR